jgi:hypothetical protein
MFIDKALIFSDGQALTATAVSTDVLDLDAARAGSLGVGEPLAVVVQVTVAAGGTNPTLSVQVQTDDNSAFSSAVTRNASKVYTQAELAAGAILVLPLDNLGSERFMRLNYVMTGTTPTVTVKARLTPLSMVQNYVAHPIGYSIAG